MARRQRRRVLPGRTGAAAHAPVLRPRPRRIHRGFHPRAQRAAYTSTLLPAVAGYGLVLGGTAAFAARCSPLIATGGVFFLLSDTVLAFRLFLADTMPQWTSPLVMLTYTLGQGLIVAGALVALRKRSIR